MPPWATPGVARSCFHGWIAASPTTKISGCPGIVRSGPTRIRPLRSVSAPVAAATLRPNDAASTPAAQSTVRAWISSSPPSGFLTRTRPSSMCDDLGLRADDDAEPLQLAPRGGRAPGGKVGRTRSIASTSTIRASCGSDRAEVVAQRVVRDLAQGAGELHARRPAADEHERHPRLAQLGIGLALGGLERDQDPAPDLDGVVDGLEARGVRRPLVVPEVGVVGARRDDQRVVVHRAAVRQPDLALLGVDVDRLAQQHPRVASGGGRSSAAAARSRPATARRSRPGTASAGTGGGSAGRSA